MWINTGKKKKCSELTLYYGYTLTNVPQIQLFTCNLYLPLTYIVLLQQTGHFQHLIVSQTNGKIEATDRIAPRQHSNMHVLHVWWCLCYTIIFTSYLQRLLEIIHRHIVCNNNQITSTLFHQKLKKWLNWLIYTINESLTPFVSLF